MAYCRDVRQIFAAAALAALTCFVVLIIHQPNIEYAGQGFETECLSLREAGGSSTLTDGDSFAGEPRIVRGQDAVARWNLRALDNGVVDEGFVQRQLRADCSDERAHLLVWTQVALAGFVFGVGGALWPRRQGTAPGHRAAEDLPDRSRYSDPDFGTPPANKH